MSLIASKLILKLHANDLQPNWLKLCIFLIFLMQMPTECETRESLVRNTKHLNSH